MDDIEFKFVKELPEDQVIKLYSALEWSCVSKPKELLKALTNSHAVVSAWDGDQLVGLGNSLSDGHLVVYYPHLLVLPAYQGKGIGGKLLSLLKNKYAGFHQQVLIADGKAIDFYTGRGFNKAGASQPLWIYDGQEHD